MNLPNLKLDYYFLILFKMKKIITLLVVFSLYSCGSQLYVPIESINSISVENLKKGRELYVKNCASCHQLFLPNYQNNEQWIVSLNSMQERSKISDEQKKLILDYLVNAPK